MNKKYQQIMIAACVTLLSACATHNTDLALNSKQKPWIVPDFVQKSYASVENEPYYLPPIDLKQIEPKYWRQNVYYPTEHKPGTLVVDTTNRFLYYTMPNGEAIRYGIGVGKSGLALKGHATVTLKKQWPHWTPTAQMQKRDPERYGHMGAGLPPGTTNPLGARALYLYRAGKDTHFRIHGSNEAWSIGQAVSSGCIRMLNQDAIDLYKRVDVGTQVVVL